MVRNCLKTVQKRAEQSKKTENGVWMTRIYSEASGAPLLSKFGNLSIREILVVTSAYARPYRLCGRGGESQDNPTGVANAIFSWREIARCFWATGGKSHDHRRF